jgi:hypothetical protein
MSVPVGLTGFLLSSNCCCLQLRAQDLFFSFKKRKTARARNCKQQQFEDNKKPVRPTGTDISIFFINKIKK